MAAKKSPRGAHSASTRSRKTTTKKAARPAKKAARPTKKNARPTKKAAGATKKTARPVKKTARPTKKTARPAKKAARPTKKAARPTKKAAPKKTKVAAQATMRTAPPAAEPPPLRSPPPAPDVALPSKPRAPLRSGLRELVPTAIRADDEENEFLREYKRKWLSRIDFKSDTYVDSLLFLAYLELALGRAQEAEWTADLLIRFVHFRNASPASRDDVIAALRLTAYLKARRGRDVSRLVAGTRSLSQRSVHHSREWLSHDARAEIDEALERQKLALLAYPMAGILAWLNEPAARPFAEPLLERALAAMRTFMT